MTWTGGILVVTWRVGVRYADVYVFSNVNGFRRSVLMWALLLALGLTAICGFDMGKCRYLSCALMLGCAM